MNQIRAKNILKWLFWLSLVSPVLYWQKLQYPFITTKAVLFQILVELALPFYLYLLVSYKEFRPNLRNPLNLTIILFLIVSFISALSGVNFDQSFWGSQDRMTGVFNLVHLTLLYFYFLLLARSDEEFIQKTFKVMVYVSALISLYAVWTGIGLPKLFRELYPPRVSSVMGNPIFLASYLVIPLFFTGLLFVEEERLKAKLWFAFLAVIQFFAIYFSQTRGVLLGIAIGVFTATCILFFFRENKKFKLYGLALLVIIILAGGWAIRSRIGFNDNNSKARLIQWKTGLKGFKDYPILGTGPENYYVIANKYADIAIYRYDSSWWTKPHNSFLEILITTGLIGFLSYLAINLVVIWLLWKAYISDTISLVHISIFAGAFVAFQIQNFFAFDTIPASLVFFILLAAINYFSHSSEQENKQTRMDSKGLADTLFIVGGLIAIVLIYLNILTVRSAYALNKGVSLQSTDPKTSKKYFDEAVNTAIGTSRRGGVLIYYQQQLVSALDKVDQDFLLDDANNNIQLWEAETAKVKDDPSYWLQFGNVYSVKANILHNDPDSLNHAVDAIAKATELVPNRTEPLFELAIIDISLNKLDDAYNALSKVPAIVPSDTNSDWHRANKGITVQVYSSLIEKYSKVPDYQKILTLYNQEIAIVPDNFQLYSGLAATYASVGDKQKAIEAANKVLELNPAAKADVEAFIKSLQ